MFSDILKRLTQPKRSVSLLKTLSLFKFFIILRFIIFTKSTISHSVIHVFHATKFFLTFFAIIFDNFSFEQLVNRYSEQKAQNKVLELARSLLLPIFLKTEELYDNTLAVREVLALTYVKFKQLRGRLHFHYL